MQPVFGFHTFIGHPRPHHLGEAINIHRVHVKSSLHLGPHGVGPRLGAKNTHIQRAFARIAALLAVFVQNREHIARRYHNGTGPEILDQAHLPVGHATADRHHGAAQPLGPVMRAQTAGKQPVAISDMHHIARPRAAGAHGAGHYVGPRRNIVFGVAHHRGLPRGATGGMDAGNLRARHGKHAKRVVVAQVLLHGKGEFSEVG